MKICFIAGTLGLGGAERQLYYMIKTLTEHHVPCQVLCLTRGEIYEERIRALGVPVIWVGQSSNRAFRLWRIMTEVRKLRPDIVQSAHSYTSLYATIAAKACRRIDIAAIRNQGLEEYTDHGILGKISLRLCSNIVGNSKSALNSIKTKYKSKSTYILENVVDCAAFHPRDILSKNKQPRLISIGRLVAQKRHDLFLKTVALVRDSVPKASGTIVGSGPLLNDLTNLAHLLNLQDCVRFAGSTDSVVDYYHNTDILVLTSDYEGTPNVVLEAMACGLPVITTRVGGISDLVIDGKTGFIVDCGDVETLAQRVIQLAEDIELRKRMGQAAREEIVRYYSLDTLYEKLVAIYQSVSI